MVYNKIPAVFSGTSRIAIAEPVNYQYDVTQILVISGLELPEYYEVDFCNVGDAQTVTMIGTDDGVAIPDVFLATGKKIKAYIVVQGEDEGAVETRYEVTIPVNKRPERTDIEPTPAEELVIDGLIAALNDGVTRAETAVGNAEGYATNASNSAGDASGYATAAENAKDAAVVAQGKAEDAQEKAETAQGKAEDAQTAAESAASSISGYAPQIEQNTNDIADIKRAMQAGLISFTDTGNGNIVIAKITEEG